MVQWFRQLDRVLRGDAVRDGGLGSGPGHVSARGLAVVAVLLAGVYGAGVGSFAVIRTGGESWMQLLASAVKMPLLFFLTLVVTLPSLYVFSALVGARLRAVSVARLLVSMVGVAVAVLASFSPIVVFFGVSTTSYPFMKLLNVAMCGVAGVLALMFMLRTLQTMVREAEDEEGRSELVLTTDLSAEEREAAEEMQRRREAEVRRRAGNVFRIWVLLFGFVGVQMSWVLRPFVGDPALPFAWFRDRESNFFADVFEALVTLLGG